VVAGGVNLPFGPFIAILCCTGVVKSAGMAGKLAPAITPAARSGRAMTRVKKVSMMQKLTYDAFVRIVTT
jgi:hypothetical protein